MNKSFLGLARPSHFLLVPHSRKYNIQLFSSPRSLLTVSRSPSSHHPLPSHHPPSALSATQKLYGLQSQGNHLIPQMTKPCSPSLTFSPHWESSAASFFSTMSPTQVWTNQNLNKIRISKPINTFSQSIHGFCFHCSQIGHFFLYFQLSWHYLNLLWRKLAKEEKKYLNSVTSINQSIN